MISATMQFGSQGADAQGHGTKLVVFLLRSGVQKKKIQASLFEIATNPRRFAELLSFCRIVVVLLNHCSQTIINSAYAQGKRLR